ncbi:patatin-like protein [Alteriqipengyuania lutimaris]|uniref:Patatin-like protein n=1 Tax=Alteriqipengyuania lutimaris TaxID=1538146 RepID=A0A395LMP3_9SPHN|nr:patatin-like protein [Alteriqipengyuania lutimaris]MBB3032886.1 patatin-related protein [Alteriqipengyuania lutimaris]RDS78025.1 patatin-like protein [Alteriqipengyuania lutimaris]
MRQKELRIALVCYGGVSLAVYMHGVTKEVWNLARASRALHSGEDSPSGVAAAYRELLDLLADEHELRLRVLPDIFSGASAGGINAVFLAQAIHSGRSLEPLTDMWLDNADIDRLTAEDARMGWRFAKVWAQPLANFVLRRPGNLVSESVAPETRAEVREKVSKLVRGRWFQPPFSGETMSRMLLEALEAMDSVPADGPLLPPGHPIDLYVPTTDFHGYLAHLRLNSPPVVKESEHRMPISFNSRTPEAAGQWLADPFELAFAARATASFPGAFPPLRIDEIDALAEETGRAWHGREAFLRRIMPAHMDDGTAEGVSLIDGSVLVNRPFEGAIDALRGRPAVREVERRFAYIDPQPDRYVRDEARVREPVGFFESIFGSLSTLPREQPIRDNLEGIAEQSRHAEKLQAMIAQMRPQVESAVEKLFDRTVFFDRPTPRRLANWRGKAQQAAAEQAGYTFAGYAELKFVGILERIAELVRKAAPKDFEPDVQTITHRLRGALRERGLETLVSDGGGASPEAVAFFRSFDLAFRVRRLRLLARRTARDWERDPDIPNEAIDRARASIYLILAAYFENDGLDPLGPQFKDLARNVMIDPGAVLDHVAGVRDLLTLDTNSEKAFAHALGDMPRELRRRMMYAYLGFPFYDVATLPILGMQGMNEFEPVKVDRISPEDAQAIREGGTSATLRGIEFYDFGAFFSRAYRENDYLWGRLHGCERMVDIVLSTSDRPVEPQKRRAILRRALLAIIDEEVEAGRCGEESLKALRDEIETRLGTA